MKPASIYTLLGVVAEIARAQKVCPKRVESEIERAASIDELIESLTNISAKPEVNQLAGLRFGDENITIPLLDGSRLTLVLRKIIAVNTHSDLITIFTDSVIFNIGLSSEDDNNQVSPEVFEKLTEYFWD